MWLDTYNKNSFFHLFHTYRPTIERKIVLGAVMNFQTDSIHGKCTWSTHGKLPAGAFFELEIKLQVHAPQIF